MTSFEERLLAEVRTLVGADQPADAEPVVRAGQPQTVPQEAARRRARLPEASGERRLRPRRRSAVGIVLAVLAAIGFAAGAVAWPPRLAAPAYAVDRNPDGSFLVTVNDLSAPITLQQVLQTDGIPVTVRRLSTGHTCLEHPRTVPAPGVLVVRPGRLNTLIIQPALLPRGSSVLLGVGGSPGQVLLVGMVVRGAPPRCLPSVVTTPG